MNTNNRRLIKNTGLLYFRLIFLTFINLYAVRVTLEALGKIDYGVFSVIASVVMSMSILTGALTSASQRYLSYHLGKNDYEKYSHTFTLLLLTFVILAGTLIVIGEGLGYFFIEKWLDIPTDRIQAAYWVFQTVLATFAFSLVTIPYTSSIVANERMDAFAIFSIVEGVLKLAIALILIHYGGDRLILYGVLTAVISIVVFLMSMQYCHSKFKYCRYIWKWNGDTFKGLMGYTGWNLFGSLSGMLDNQGQNILLNIYFGPIINTAKAIADRIQNVVSGFSANIYMAASPQIIKSYAAEEYDRALSLVMKTSKMSFLLLFVLSFPLICNMDGLLSIWLGADANTPDMTVFSQLILVYCLVISLEPPISRIIQATGDIKRYQLSVGAITLTYIPIAVLAFELGGSAILSIVILIAVMAIAHILRIFVAKRQVNLRPWEYCKEVAIPILKVSIIGGAAFMLSPLCSTSSDSFALILLRTATATLCGLFIAVILGLNQEDRQFISGLIKDKLHKTRI
ncbi:MAG: hypothetical protein K2I08_01815 [Muribaculaceae bacterium]|nr:hypothetical protein [Muribaculaceae bacterium]